MGSLAVVAASVAALALCVGLILFAVRLRARVQEAAEQAAQVQRELARSRGELAALGEQVARLSERPAVPQPVQQTGHDPGATAPGLPALPARSDYVITSLSGATSLLPAQPRPLSRLVEDRVVRAVARRQDDSAANGHAAEVVVRALALGHGVRRALSHDVLDRAAAESSVARRRSRRERRRELREVRRVVRAVRAEPRSAEQDVA